MMNTAQQIAARKPFVDMLTRNALATGPVQHGCAYLMHVVTPTVAGGLWALPDYSATR